MDKTWGQGQDLYRGSYGKKHPYSSMSHVRGRPFLIAIAPFDSDLSLSQNNELINMVLFGMAPPVLEGARPRETRQVNPSSEAFGCAG
ncbi:hypothetical protein [Sinorhizobium fredii]|uniref:hypothetical protein n=1 Tax=Rhizobium fredii TaxID=380 RepID=UPI0012FDC860|nr:hypothetical protein [Sinorhizobium fredii]